MIKCGGLRKISIQDVWFSVILVCVWPIFNLCPKNYLLSCLLHPLAQSKLKTPGQLICAGWSECGLLYNKAQSCESGGLDLLTTWLLDRVD